MSDTFEVQVRDLLAQQVDAGPAAHEWAEVERRAFGPDLPAPAGGPRSTVVVWMAIAAAVVLLIAGAVFVLGDEGDSVRMDEGPSTTVSESPESTTGENRTEEEGQTTDDGSTPDAAPGTPPGEFAPIAPGAWHLAATVAEPSFPPDELDQIAAEVRKWPGVIDVETAVDAAAWERLTGLPSSLCDGARSGPPCGPGVVALLLDGQQEPIGRRLETELDMSTLSALEAPVEFIEAYFAAAVDRASPAPIRFDPAPLGTEISLTGPQTNLAAQVRPCSLPQCEVIDVVAVDLNVDGEDLRVSLALVDHESGPELVLQAGGTGYIDVGELYPGPGGRAGVVGIRLPGLGTTFDEAARSAVILVGLPLDVAVVTSQSVDGTTVWQRPLGGMAVLPDAPGSSGDFDPEAVTTVTALDGGGDEILLINVGDPEPEQELSSPHATVVTDLRVDADRLATAEATLAQIVAETSRVVEAGDLTVTWTQGTWGPDEGPRLIDTFQSMVSTPTGVLSVGEQGIVWRWSDAGLWTTLDELAEYDVNRLVQGGGRVVAGALRRADFRRVLLSSSDGSRWTELDGVGYSVSATSTSGLTIVGSASEAGIVAVIDDDGTVETFDAPWAPPPNPSDPDLHFFEVLDDLAGGTVVIRYLVDNDESGEATITSEAWRYLGNGQFAPPTPVPLSFRSARLGDTILRFDRTGYESGGERTITGRTSEATLITTGNGTDWTVHSTLTAETTSGLDIQAGDFFWVYGLDGGFNMLQRYRSFATIWISTDAVNWSALDVSFTAPRAQIRVVGDTIFAFWDDDHWVGKVEAAS